MDEKKIKKNMSPRRRWLSTLGATALQQLSTRPMAYNGLMIDATPTTCGATIAAALDELSRGAEQQQRPNSVWLRVPMAQSALIAQVAPLGFRYHHAEGETAHLVLWFAAGGGPSAIPEYATHQVGVGAVVVHPHPGDAHPQVLVVKEAAWPDRGWKLPGGLAELGEHFGATAEREVREETGVAARFERVLAMRHQHGVAFGRSDLYVVCLLRGLAAAGTEGSTLAIRRDEREACVIF